MVMNPDDLLKSLKEVRKGGKPVAVPGTATTSNTSGWKSATVKPGVGPTVKGGVKGAAMSALGFVAKPVLDALVIVDTPRRAIVSGVRELVDVLDSDIKTNASWSDWYKQAKDPTYGVGTAFPMKGWMGRIVGFVGDVALDPLTYATFGGTIAKKSVTSGGKLTREAIGVRNVTGRTGREALASYANKRLIKLRELGVTREGGQLIDDAFISQVTKDVASRGKSRLPGFLATDIGIKSPGIYYFGSRIKVPGSGLLGDFIERGLVSTRLGLVSPKFGLNPLAKLHRAVTPDMKFQLSHVEAGAIRAYRVGLANGTLSPKEAEQGLIVLRGADVQRGDTTKAKEAFQQIVRPSVSDARLKPHKNTIHRLMEGVATPEDVRLAATDGRQQLADNLSTAMLDIYKKVVTRMRMVHPKYPIGKTENYFPYMLSDSAMLWDETTGWESSIPLGTESPRGLNSVSLDGRHRKASSFRRRRTEEGDWFWGHILEKKDMDVDSLNRLARNPGDVPAPENTPIVFQRALDFDLFETDIEQVMAKYIYHASQEYGTAGFMSTVLADGKFMLDAHPLRADAAAIAANAPAAHMTRVLSILDGDIVFPARRALDDVTFSFPELFGKPMSGVPTPTPVVAAATPTPVASAQTAGEQITSIFSGLTAAIKSELGTPSPVVSAVVGTEPAVGTLVPTSVTPLTPAKDLVTNPIGQVVTKLRRVLEASLDAFDNADASMVALDDLLLPDTIGTSVYKILRQNFDSLRLEAQNIANILQQADSLSPNEQLGSLISGLARTPEFSRLPAISLRLAEELEEVPVRNVMIDLEKRIRENFSYLDSFKRDTQELLKIQDFVPKLEPKHWMQKLSYGSEAGDVRRTLDLVSTVRTQLDSKDIKTVLDDLAAGLELAGYPVVKTSSADMMAMYGHGSGFAVDPEDVAAEDIARAMYRRRIAALPVVQRRYAKIEEDLYYLQQGHLGRGKAYPADWVGETELWEPQARFGKVGYLQLHFDTVARIEDLSIYVNVRQEFKEMADIFNLNGIVLGDDFVDNLFFKHMQPFRQVYQADIPEIVELREVMKRLRVTVGESGSEIMDTTKYLKEQLTPAQYALYGKYLDTDLFRYSIGVDIKRKQGLRVAQIQGQIKSVKAHIKRLKADKVTYTKSPGAKQAAIKASKDILDNLMYENGLDATIDLQNWSSLSKRWFGYVLGSSEGVSSSMDSYLLNLETSYANRINDMTNRVSSWRDEGSDYLMVQTSITGAGPVRRTRLNKSTGRTEYEPVSTGESYLRDDTTGVFGRRGEKVTVEMDYGVPAPRKGVKPVLQPLSDAQELQKYPLAKQREYLIQKNIKVARQKNMQKVKDSTQKELLLAQRDFDNSNESFLRVLASVRERHMVAGTMGTLDYSNIKNRQAFFTGLKAQDNPWRFRPEIITNDALTLRPDKANSLIHQIFGEKVGSHFPGKKGKFLSDYFGALTPEEIDRYAFAQWDTFVRNNRDMIEFVDAIGAYMTRHEVWQSSQSLDVVEELGQVMLSSADGARFAELLSNPKYAGLIDKEKDELLDSLRVVMLVGDTAKTADFHNILGKSRVNFKDAYEGAHEILFRKFLYDVEKDWQDVVLPARNNLSELTKSLKLADGQLSQAERIVGLFTPRRFFAGKGIEPVPTSAIVHENVLEVQRLQGDDFYPIAKNEANKVLMKNFYAEFDVDKIDWSLGGTVDWTLRNKYNPGRKLLTFQEMYGNETFQYEIFRTDIESGLKFSDFEARVYEDIRNEALFIKRASYDSTKNPTFSGPTQAEYAKVRFRLLSPQQEGKTAGKPKFLQEYQESNLLNDNIYRRQSNDGVLGLKALQLGLFPGKEGDNIALLQATRAIKSDPAFRDKVVKAWFDKTKLGTIRSYRISQEDLVAQLTEHLYNTQPGARRPDAERIFGQREVAKEWLESPAGKYLTRINELKKQLLEAHRVIQMNDPVRVADAAVTAAKQAEVLGDGVGAIPVWTSSVSARVDFNLSEVSKAHIRMQSKWFSDGVVAEPVGWVSEEPARIIVRTKNGRKRNIRIPEKPGKEKRIKVDDYTFDDNSRPKKYEVIVDVTDAAKLDYSPQLQQWLGMDGSKGNADIIQSVNRILTDREFGLVGKSVSEEDVRRYIEQGKKLEALKNRRNVKSRSIKFDDESGSLDDINFSESLDSADEVLLPSESPTSSLYGSAGSYEDGFMGVKSEIDFKHLIDGDYSGKWQEMEILLDAGYRFRRVESPQWKKTKELLDQVGEGDALTGTLDQLNNAMFYVSILPRFEDVLRVKQSTDFLDSILRMPVAGKNAVQIRKEIEILSTYSRLGIQTDYVSDRVWPLVRERIARLNELEPMTQNDYIQLRSKLRTDVNTANSFFDDIRKNGESRARQESQRTARKKALEDEKKYDLASDDALTADETFFRTGDQESQLNDNEYRESILQFQRDMGPQSDFKTTAEYAEIAREIEERERMLTSYEFFDENSNQVPFAEVQQGVGPSGQFEYSHNGKPVTWGMGQESLQRPTTTGLESATRQVSLPKQPILSTGVTRSPIDYEYYQTTFIDELGVQEYLPEPLQLSITKFTPDNISDLPPTASAIERVVGVYHHLLRLRDTGELSSGSPLIAEINDIINYLDTFAADQRVNGKLSLTEALDVDYVTKTVENISSRHAAAKEQTLKDLLTLEVLPEARYPRDGVLAAEVAVQVEQKVQEKIDAGLMAFTADTIDTATGEIQRAAITTTIMAKPVAPVSVTTVAPRILAPPKIIVPSILGPQLPTISRFRKELLDGWEYIDKTHFGSKVLSTEKYVDSSFGKSMSEIWRNATYFEKPENLRVLNKYIGPYTKFFKAYIVSTPGFQTRNALANAVQFILAGGSPKNLKPGMEAYINWIKAYNSGVKWPDYLKSLPVEQAVHIAHARNALAISGGSIYGDVFHAVMKGNPISDNKFTRKMGRWAQNSDNVSRFALAYDSSLKGSPDVNFTAARIKKFYIDYEDISQLDEYMRLFVPFWIWTSRNFTVQLENIFLNPKPYNIYNSFVRNMSDKDKEESLPRYAKNASGWGIPGSMGLMATPDLNFNRAKETGAQLLNAGGGLGNLTPLLKVPIEQIAGKRFYNDKQFEGVDDRLMAILKGLAPPAEMASRLFASEGDNQLNAMLGFVGSPIKKIPYYEKE